MLFIQEYGKVTVKIFISALFLFLTVALMSCGEEVAGSEGNISSEGDTSSQGDSSSQISQSSSGESESSAGENSSGGSSSLGGGNASGDLIANHEIAFWENVDLEKAAYAVEYLEIAYGHTSHGSQLVTGMTALSDWKDGVPFMGDEGLRLRDRPFSGASDLGNPDRVSWVGATRNYLNENSEINVILWSWCGQVSSASETDIQGYLDSMSALEADYPEVVFVYMTGHLDGTGPGGNLNQRNNQIREFARNNDKVLYDFADIESFDPDGNSYMEYFADDGCNYYEVNDEGERGAQAGNWCTEWQEAHPEEWFETSAAHSQALNGNRKAYSAWWLFGEIAREFF
jgi:hypothetical protein